MVWKTSGSKYIASDAMCNLFYRFQTDYNDKCHDKVWQCELGPFVNTPIDRFSHNI